MKYKFLLVALILSLVFIPINTFAAGEGAGSDYKSLTFKETLEAEEIEPEFSDYEETDDKATIYMFRGQGCSYCRAFLTHMNEEVDDLGDYFRIVTYEVWQDSKNNELLNKVSSFLGQEATGVPYIVIGDKVFTGYASDYDDDIEEAIMNLYNSKDRYDVFEKMAASDTDEKSEKSSNDSNFLVIIWSAIFITIGTAITSGYVYSCHTKTMKRIESLENDLKEQLEKVETKIEIKPKAKTTTARAPRKRKKQDEQEKND